MKQGHVNKVNSQSITIFNYYLQHLLPSLLRDFPSIITGPHLYQAQHRNINYHYKADLSHCSSDITPQIVLNSAKELFLKDLTSKNNHNSAIKETTCRLRMLPISANVVDQVDILISKPQRKQSDSKRINAYKYRQSGTSSQRNLFGSPSREYQRVKQAKSIGVGKQDQVWELFVIHRSLQNLSSLNWLNFIERFRFVKGKSDDEEDEWKIIHEAILAYTTEKSLFSLDQTPRLLQNYFQLSYPMNKENKSLNLVKLVQKIDSMIMLEAKQLKQKREKASFSQSHRRSLKFKPEEKKTLSRLLPRAEDYFRQLNPLRPINNCFLEQLVCRMMENNDFKEKESWEAIIYYLEFEKKMRQKYTWEDFKEFRDMNFFTFIGKDKTGRPVLLNRVRYTLLSQVKDKDKLYDFHLYLFQIYMQDQMIGWVDQFDVIGDAADQVNENTDILFTKKLLFQLAKTSLGRCAHIVAFNLGFITKLFLKMIFPLLPEVFMRIINLYAEEGEEVREKLKQLMTDDVIPEFLGGNNKDADTSSDGKRNQSKDGRSSEITEGYSFQGRLRLGST